MKRNRRREKREKCHFLSANENSKLKSVSGNVLKLKLLKVKGVLDRKAEVLHSFSMGKICVKK